MSYVSANLPIKHGETINGKPLHTNMLQLCSWHLICLLKNRKKSKTFNLQKTMKNRSKTLLAALTIGMLSCGLSTEQAQATPIQGIINFGGAVQLNGPFATATAVTNWLNAHVEAGTTGDFAGIAVNTPVAMSSWTFAPSTPTPSLWSVGGFTFDLLSSTVVTHNNQFLTISGSGIVSGNGFDATAMEWSFSIQNRGGTIFSFSATNGVAVPDGGSAICLLGLALVGIEVLRRKLYPSTR